MHAHPVLSPKVVQEWPLAFAVEGERGEVPANMSTRIVDVRRVPPNRRERVRPQQAVHEAPALKGEAPHLVNCGAWVLPRSVNGSGPVIPREPGEQIVIPDTPPSERVDRHGGLREGVSRWGRSPSKAGLEEKPRAALPRRRKGRRKTAAGPPREERVGFQNFGQAEA